MRPCSLRPILLLVLLAAPAALFAEIETSSKEEDRLDALSREDAEWYAPKNSITVGFRVLASGTNVHFGKLGTVPVPIQYRVAPIAAGVGPRTYMNGSVNVDAPSGDELDSYGNQTSTPGKRYYTYTYTTTDVIVNGVKVGTTTTQTVAKDGLAYTPGLTRRWSYDSPNQITPEGDVALSSYSTSSDGAFANKKQGPTAGVELQFAHVMGKLSKRTEWSLVAGLALNSINNKTAGDVRATLITNTDKYVPDYTAVLGAHVLPPATPSTPYSGPSSTTDGTKVIDTTVPIGVVALENNITTTAGGTTVHGKWQVKGAYFMVRVGPSIHTQLTEHIGISASVGLAGAFAGTNYSAAESFQIPDVGTTISNPVESSDETKLLGGYYADLNVDLALNDRTGLYTGVSAQKFGGYQQTLDARTASVDLGSTVGIRGGVSIKF